MRKAKRISDAFVLWGGYGGHNLGDEAILWALSRQLRRHRPDAKQYVLVRGAISAATRAQYAAWQIEIVSLSLRALPVLRRARLVVGGGQMVDDSSLGWPVGWSALLLLANRLLGNRPLVLNIGAEPLTRKPTRALVKYVYSLALVCTCRDQESCEVLADAGVPPTKVWRTRDVVFSLNRSLLTPGTTHPADVGTAAADPRRTICVVIAYDPRRIREGSERSIQLIDHLLRNGHRIHLVAHDLRPEYDPQALAQVQQHFLDDPRVTTASASSVAEILAVYRHSDAVISGRMHPLILAALAGSLPVAFGGKAKVRSLLAVSSFPSLSPEDPAQQSAEVDALLSRRPELLAQIDKVLDSFRDEVDTTMAKALAL